MGRTVLGFLGGSNVITRVLIRVIQEGQRRGHAMMEAEDGLM